MKKAFYMSLIIAFFLVFSVGIFSQYSEASGSILIKGFRHWSSEQYTRVVVDTDGPITFTKNLLSNPDRLYFDIKNSRLSSKKNPSITIDDGILKRVRAGQFKNDTVRVVLDLHVIGSFNAFVLREPDRLVIDVFSNKGTKDSPQKKGQKKYAAIKRVIIDPGHGGEDPGAIGPRGLKEKDVVLAVAKRLGKILRDKYHMEVIFTRDRDVFIPLEERTAIANSKKGDLFISIHTNASRKKKTRGIETYFLNWTTNREAMKVAARENAISLKKMSEAQNELQMILQDLKRENKKSESMAFAYSVQDAMVENLSRDYKKIVDLGVKYALFYVLLGAEMPSILAEVSFISNKVEEYRLSKKGYRNKIAEAIAHGVYEYTTPPKLVMRARDSN
jgi:N-acetylmuramoyl-L-alanine amidase